MERWWLAEARLSGAVTSLAGIIISRISHLTTAHLTSHQHSCQNTLSLISHYPSSHINTPHLTSHHTSPHITSHHPSSHSTPQTTRITSHHPSHHTSPHITPPLPPFCQLPSLPTLVQLSGDGTPAWDLISHHTTHLSHPFVRAVLPVHPQYNSTRRRAVHVGTRLVPLRSSSEGESGPVR